MAGHSTKSTENYMKEIQEREEHIASLTIQINELDRQLTLIETEASEALKHWYQFPPKDEDEKTKRKNLMDAINRREQDKDAEYVKLRTERDQLMQGLRGRYHEAIKAFHKDKTDGGKDKGKGGHAGASVPFGASAGSSKISLHNSSILSGTSQMGSDDKNFKRLFVNWELTQPVKAKKEEKEKKSVLPKATYYGSIRCASIDAQTVCVKKFEHLDDSQFKTLSDRYKAMKDDLLGHPNLLTPVGAVTAEKQIILEWAKNSHGPSLQDILDHNKAAEESNSTEKEIKLGFLLKLYIAKSTCSALSWLHENNSSYSHLRLKPSNILFTSDNKIKVSDYGLGLPKLYFKDKATVEKISFDSKLVHYSAPEVFDESSTTDQSSDLWSFGLILYTLITGKIPFDKSTCYEEVKNAVLQNKPIELPKNTPSKMKSLINSCCHFEKEKRPKFKELAEGDNWDDIYKEALTIGNEIINHIWKQAENDDNPEEQSKSEEQEKKEKIKKDKLSWEIFRKYFWKELGFNINSLPEGAEDCFKILLMVEKKTGDLVNFTHLSNFATVLGPVTSGKDGPKFVSSVIAMCQKEWYFGPCDRTVAEGVINDSLRKKIKNPCLVRNSVNPAQHFSYILTFLKIDSLKGLKGNEKLEVTHLPIPSADYSSNGFEAHFNSLVAKNGLTPVTNSHERPFKTIFDKSHHNLQAFTTQSMDINSAQRNAAMKSTGGVMGSSSLQIIR